MQIPAKSPTPFPLPSGVRASNISLSTRLTFLDSPVTHPNHFFRPVSVGCERVVLETHTPSVVPVGHSPLLYVVLLCPPLRSTLRGLVHPTPIQYVLSVSQAFGMKSSEIHPKTPDTSHLHKSCSSVSPLPLFCKIYTQSYHNCTLLLPAGSEVFPSELKK